MAEKTEKGRYFAGLIAADSAPENWREILKNSHAPFAISPLHQPDSENSYPHYHVVYKHSNTITLDGAKRALPSGVFKNDYLVLLHHPRIYQRYLIHLDNSDKQQFAEGRNAIEVINGFPLDLSRDFSQEERLQQKKEIFAFIRENSIVEYAELLDSLMMSGYNDLFDCACCNTVLFNSYLTSRRNSVLGLKNRGLVYCDN